MYFLQIYSKVRKSIWILSQNCWFDSHLHILSISALLVALEEAGDEGEDNTDDGTDKDEEEKGKKNIEKNYPQHF